MSLRQGAGEVARNRSVPAGLLATSLSASAFAQGGPPFLTDDPGTPGNRNWEINLGLIGDCNLSEGAYSIPEIGINYGIGDRSKLTWRVPLAIHESRDAGESVAAGLGIRCSG